jgi:hypothetical protein
MGRGSARRCDRRGSTLPTEPDVYALGGRVATRRPRATPKPAAGDIPQFKVEDLDPERAGKVLDLLAEAAEKGAPAWDCKR